MHAIIAALSILSLALSAIALAFEAWDNRPTSRLLGR